MHSRYFGESSRTRGCKFDHAIPAHLLTEGRDEFFANVDPSTLDRFENLFQLLNATVQE